MSDRAPKTDSMHLRSSNTFPVCRTFGGTELAANYPPLIILGCTVVDNK